MAEALRAALERWPVDGVPRSPEAWLTMVAKNQLRQEARHRSVVSRPDIIAALEWKTEALPAMATPDGALGTTIPDERLRLMFVCAHPAIDAAVRTPLMLQTVLGLDAARIAAAWLVPPATMGQRLVRAKQKIRDAAIPFELPQGPALRLRLDAVLEGIYAAFGAGWEGSGAQPGQAQECLRQEALFLARVLVDQLPNEAEALGLLALLTFSEARRSARLDGDGAFVPLAQQDTSRWQRDAIVEAERLLLHAAAQRQPGPFQLEAAIQSAHCQRLFSGSTPWRAIVALYETLNRHAPTVASHIGHAAALLELGDWPAAQAELAALDAKAVDAHAPYWVVSAHTARAQGDVDAALRCFQRAIALSTDDAVRNYLQAQRSKTKRA